MAKAKKSEQLRKAGEAEDALTNEVAQFGLTLLSGVTADQNQQAADRAQLAISQQTKLSNLAETARLASGQAVRLQGRRIRARLSEIQERGQELVQEDGKLATAQREAFAAWFADCETQLRATHESRFAGLAEFVERVDGKPLDDKTVIQAHTQLQLEITKPGGKTEEQRVTYKPHEDVWSPARDLRERREPARLRAALRLCVHNLEGRRVGYLAPAGFQDELLKRHQAHLDLEAKIEDLRDMRTRYEQELRPERLADRREELEHSLLLGAAGETTANKFLNLAERCASLAMDALERQHGRPEQAVDVHSV